MSHGRIRFLMVGDELELTRGSPPRRIELFTATAPTACCMTCGRHWPAEDPPPLYCGFNACDHCGLEITQHAEGHCLFDSTMFYVTLMEA